MLVPKLERKGCVSGASTPAWRSASRSARGDDVPREGRGGEPCQVRAAIDGAIVGILVALLGARIRNQRVIRTEIHRESTHPQIDVLMVICAKPPRIERCTDGELTAREIMGRLNAQPGIIGMGVKFRPVGPVLVINAAHRYETVESDEIEITIDVATEPG